MRFGYHQEVGKIVSKEEFLDLTLKDMFMEQ